MGMGCVGMGGDGHEPWNRCRTLLWTWTWSEYLSHWYTTYSPWAAGIVVVLVIHILDKLAAMSSNCVMMTCVHKVGVITICLIAKTVPAVVPASRPVFRVLSSSKDSAGDCHPQTPWPCPSVWESGTWLFVLNKFDTTDLKYIINHACLQSGVWVWWLAYLSVSFYLKSTRYSCDTCIRRWRLLYSE